MGKKKNIDFRVYAFYTFHFPLKNFFHFASHLSENGKISVQMSVTYCYWHASSWNATRNEGIRRSFSLLVVSGVVLKNFIVHFLT